MPNVVQVELLPDQAELIIEYLKDILDQIEDDGNNELWLQRTVEGAQRRLQDAYNRL